MKLSDMIRIVSRLAKKDGAKLADAPEPTEAEAKQAAMAKVELRRGRATQARARLFLPKESRPDDDAGSGNFGDACPSDAFLTLLEKADLKGARCVARKLEALFESGYPEPNGLPGDVPVAVAALHGQERKRLIAVCAKAGPKDTLRAILRMRNLNFSGMENLWDAAMEAFPQDAEMAALCMKMNILVSRYEDRKARAEAFAAWLKFAGDSAYLGEIYKLFRICHAPKLLGRAPIAACRNAMDRATGDRMTGSRRIAEAITVCDFGDMELAEKILAGVSPDEPRLDLAREGVAGLREALGSLAEEVQDAIERFWKIAAVASDPLAVARSALREERDRVAILMPFGRAPFGRKVVVNHAKVPVPKPMHLMRIIKTTIGILQERGQAYRIHMWPWSPGKNPPLAGHVRTLAFHAIATEADTRTVVHKGSHIPDTWLIDRSGYSGFSSLRHLTRGDISRLDDAPHERDAFFRALREKYIDANFSMKRQPEAIDAVPDDHVFLATQMPSDSVQALAWIDQPTLISEAVRWAERTGRVLTIKRHPLCRDIRVTRLLDRELPTNVHVVNGPIHDLIKPARAVVVGNSGAGFEALMHGKPVIAVAPSDYQVATRTARTVAALRELLDRVDSLPDDSDFARAFVHVYLRKLVVDPNDGNAVKAALSRNFERAGWWDG